MEFWGVKIFTEFFTFQETRVLDVCKDKLIKHASREFHLQATPKFETNDEKIEADIKLKSNNQSLEEVFAKFDIKEEDKPPVPIFRAIYFAAKRNLSLYDCESLCNFLELNDTSISCHYRN